jgi:hypothetical protein
MILTRWWFILQAYDVVVEPVRIDEYTGENTPFQWSQTATVELYQVGLRQLFKTTVLMGINPVTVTELLSIELMCQLFRRWFLMGINPVTVTELYQINVSCLNNGFSKVLILLRWALSIELMLVVWSGGFWWGLNLLSMTR